LTRGYADFVYGVPGFESGGEPEEFDFPHLTEQEALAIGETRFGILADVAERLDTERDDSFRLTTPHGDRVLKVAHPADHPAAIERQLRAAEHVAEVDPAVPVQRILRTPDGRRCLQLADGRVARMLEWIPGDLLLNVPAGARELTALGHAFGRVTRALTSFEDGWVDAPNAWDLQAVPRLATLAHAFPDDAVSEALSRYNHRVVPRAGDLPVQVIHNDFNPGNVLVHAAARDFVVGILDFGDVMRSFRVADLAIALSYQLYPLGHDWSELAPMIAAFEAEVPLTSTEKSLLTTLTAARFAQRILINSWAAERENDTYDDYAAIVATLTALLSLEE
jgi:Ser/Thr protein kinase RdoA (MazF antagonist)